MDNQQKAFERVLTLIDEANCQEHVILIGSWAEFVYREAGLLPGFAPNIRTLDVDFLVKNLRRPNPPTSLVSLAKDKGFFVESDRLDGTTKILDSTGLEVEFLIGKRGAGLEPTLKTNVGVVAQALRHMEILSASTIEAPCLGHFVTVPIPEAYVVHKMVINPQRKSKSEKDINAVRGLWPYLDGEKLHAVTAKLSKKELAQVTAFIDARGLS